MVFVQTTLDGARLEVSKLTGQLSNAKKEAYALNRALTIYVALARDLGVEGDLLEAIAKFQQLRIAAETTYRSLILLYTATTPLGGAVGVAGLFLGAFMLADQMKMRSPRY